MSHPVVALLMGSRSDFSKLESAIDILKQFEVSHSVRIMSAHRTPTIVADFATNAENNGYQILIAAAGAAAHLAGVVAAHTLLPVIGIPIDNGPFQGMDSLLSTVQMPFGIPVATVAAGKAGAQNAALLAVRILALDNPRLQSKLQSYHNQQQERIIQSDKQLQKSLANPPL